jgi:plastocyanin
VRLASVLRLFLLSALAISIAGCARCPYPQTQPAGPVATAWVRDSVRVMEVQMLTTQGGASGEFEPRVVRARRRDLLRFTIRDGLAVHNVSFTAVQNDGHGVPLPADSPMLVEKGQSWQLRVDLPPGTYEFACIVHMMLGMRGTLIVDP